VDIIKATLSQDFAIQTHMNNVQHIINRFWNQVLCQINKDILE